MNIPQDHIVNVSNSNYIDILLTGIDDIHGLEKRAPDADRACKTSEARPIYQVRKFCLVKKKKSLDLQIYSRIDKTMKKLY